MSNIKVREEGYYLVKNGYSAELQIEYLKGECIWDSQLERYEKIGADDYGWIADEPLDLEQLLNEQHHKGSIDDRLAEATEYVKSLSKKQFSKDILDAGYEGPLVIL